MLNDEQVVSEIYNSQLISIFEVGINNKNKWFVRRLADLDRNGIIKQFKYDVFKASTNDNKLLFFAEFGRKNRELVVLEWSSENDIIKLNSDIILIETVIIIDCNTLEELIQNLKTGFAFVPSSTKTLFMINKDKNMCVGVLCDYNQLIVNNGMIILSDQVTELPVYMIDNSQIINLSGRQFYYKISIDLPLVNIRITDVYKSKYIELISDDELLSVISANSVLMERCKELLKTDWQKENDSMLRKAEKKIKQRTEKRDEINIEIEQLRTTLSELTKQKEGLHTIDEINSEIEKLRATISKLTKQEKGLQKIDELNSEIEKLRTTVSELTKQKNKLEKEIEDQEFRADYIKDSVTEKIEEARKNAADFVREMSFQYGMNESLNIPYNYIEGKESGVYSEPGCDDWRDRLNHLSDQLVKAGVCKKYSDSFAAFLFSAYRNQLPLLLAGPNAMEIADAFSVTMNGNTAGTLYCKADISYHDIERIIKNDDEIIKIVEPFSSRVIPALFERTYFNKYFFAIHPIAEDIIIEPKGYTNYFYPVLTDMFVDNFPFRFFDAIESNDGYQRFLVSKADKKYLKLLRELHMSMMTYNRINDVIYNLHKMLDDNSIDYDVLYAILPYAYMTMQTDKLLDAVNNKKLAVSKDLSDELNRLYGDE